MFFKVIRNLTIFCLISAILSAQTPDSVITSFDNWDTWGTGPGVADFRSSANHQGNAVAALAGGWIGAAAAGGYLYTDLDLDIQEPTVVKVKVVYNYIGGTSSYGFGSFAGISAVVGANGRNYQRDIDAAFDPDDIVGKLVGLIGLFGFYPAAAASSVGMLIEVVDAFGQIMEYMQLAENLMEIGETKKFSTTFRFKYDPGIVNRIKVGVRANASGALTGAGTAIIAGQVERIELYMKQSDGSWVATNPSQNHQWIESEINNYEDGIQWYDRKLKDISNNNHHGVYHPYSAFHLPADSYLERYDHYSVYSVMNDLMINSPYGTYDYIDEYFSLEYNPSDLRTLQRGGTFETWVKVEGDQYYRGHIFYMGDDEGGNGLGDHGEVHLSVNPDGRFEFYLGGQDNDDKELHVMTDTSFINLNDWYHVLVSYLNIDNTMKATLYIDGQEIDSETKSGTVDPNLKQIYLGKPDANERYFQGRLKGIHLRQEPFSDQKALMAYYRAGGDQTSPTIPSIYEIPEYYAGGTVNIHWDAATDVKSGVHKYKVECDNLSNLIDDIDTTVLSQNVIFTNLQNETEYQFRVQAIDSAGNSSGWSNWVSTSIDTVAPSTPNIHIEPEYTPADSNTIIWDPVEDNMDSVYYFVEICNTDQFNPYDSVNTTHYDTSQGGWITDTQYTFYNLEDDKQYYYRVVARDIPGNQSEWTDIVHSTQDHQKPYPPKINPISDRSPGDKVTVSWEPPPGSWSSLTYTIVFSFTPDPEDGFEISYITQTDTTINHLADPGDDSKLYVFLKVENEHGIESNLSAPDSTIMDYDIPEAPIISDLPETVITDTVIINFQDDVPTNSLSDLTHTLRYADNPDFTSATNVDLGSAYQYVYNFDSSDDTVYFQIKGLHSGHVSEWSNIVSTTFSTPCKPIVDALPATINSDSVKITFQDVAPTNTLQNLTHQLRFANNSDFNNAVLLNLGDDEQYTLYFRRTDINDTIYFQVRVRFHDHVSPWSDSVFTTYTPLDFKYDVYFVSPNGNDNTTPHEARHPDHLPFRTISKAFEIALAGDTIKVMDDNDPATPEYQETLTLDKPITIMGYENNSILPRIICDGYSNSDQHFFNITADSVNIIGLEFISGYIPETKIILNHCKHCIISNNSFLKSFVLLDGAVLNTIRDNKFEKHDLETTNIAIDLTNATSNFIHKNEIIDVNSYSISIAESIFNTITSNIFYKDILIKSNSDYNNISSNINSSANPQTLTVNNSDNNIITDNGPQIQLSTNSENIYYMNYFSNRLRSMDYNFYNNLCNVPTKINFRYQHDYTHKARIDNYYSDMSHYTTFNDQCGFEADGLFEMKYINIEHNDTLEISDILYTTPENYQLEAWWLGGNHLNKADMSKPGLEDTIVTGESKIWTSSEMATEDILFTSSNNPGHTWEGCFYFKNILTGSENLTVELGVASDSLGTNFNNIGPAKIISGNDSSYQVVFQMDPGTFTLNNGHYLSVRISNNTSSDKIIRTGGSWSYITSPIKASPVISSNIHPKLFKMVISNSRYNYDIYIIQNPEYITLPDLIFDEDDTSTIAFSSYYNYIDDTDSPDTTLIFSITEGQNVSVEQNETSFTLIPDKDWNSGTWLRSPDTIMLNVSDGEFSDSAHILYKLNPVNDKPTIDSIPEIVLYEANPGVNDKNIYLGGSTYVNDVDNDEDDIDISLELVNSSPNLSIRAELNNHFKIIPGGWNCHGEYPAYLVADDGQLSSDTVFFDILVQMTNNDDPDILAAPFKIFVKDTIRISKSNLGDFILDDDILINNELIIPDSIITLDTPLAVEDTADTTYSLIFSGADHMIIEKVDTDSGGLKIYTQNKFTGYDTIYVDIYDHYGILDPNSSIQRNYRERIDAEIYGPIIDTLPDLCAIGEDSVYWTGDEIHFQQIPALGDFANFIGNRYGDYIKCELSVATPNIFSLRGFYPNWYFYVNHQGHSIYEFMGSYPGELIVYNYLYPYRSDTVDIEIKLTIPNDCLPVVYDSVRITLYENDTLTINNSKLSDYIYDFNIFEQAPPIT